MKLSFDWLGDFVDLSGLSAQEVADKLTMGAFEVEEVRVVGADIVGPLVVGQILEINPHPNADKIRVTKILLAEGEEPSEIVCGAWNIEVGHKIPVALPGAKVINRKDGSALHIKAGQIRGVTSNGMLCSPSELGVSADGEGILILDADTKVGLDAKELLGLDTDYVLIVEPRSNRGDALSVLGLAREVAALFGRPLKQLDWLQEFDEMQKNASKDLPTVKTEIENSEDCPFFSIRTLSGVAGGESDGIIRRRLDAIGVKPVSKIVDITNYVMHELGQPLHAYDLRHVKGPALQVRRAKEEEVLKTIDDKERKLSSDVLVIADAETVVGVAGVMGGKDSEIADDSSEIALEAASFASAKVRRSSRKIGLSSESSLRFERGVDTASVKNASNRAAYLMVKHCGAKLGPLSCAGSDNVERPKVKVRMSELKRLCEIELVADAAGEMLEPLGFKSIPSADDYNAGVLTVSVPTFRIKDVTREIDLIEELTRVYGYDQLPVSMPSRTVPAQPLDSVPYQIRRSLAGQGLSEAWLSSLTSLSDLNCLSSSGHSNNGKHDTAIGVLNPLSTEHQVLRQSLIPGLIRAASHNQDHGTPSPWLFELGKVYFHANKVRSMAMQQANIAEHKRTNAFEEQMVSAIIVGEPSLSNWLDGKVTFNDDLHSLDMRPFYIIKGIAETLATNLRVSTCALKFESDWSEKTDSHGWLHPGRSARIVYSPDESATDKDQGKKKGRKGNPTVIGYIGELHPALADEFKLTGRAAVMELSVQSLKESMACASFAEIFVTPSMQRDLTVDLARDVKNLDVQECIKSAGDETLQDVELVSIFALSDKTKSLSYRLTFQHPSQTLTAAAVDSVMAKIREGLSSKLQAEFRL